MTGVVGLPCYAFAVSFILAALPFRSRHLPDRERGARAPAVHADDDTLEDLDALFIALAHFHVHLDGIARLHRRPIGQLRFFHQVNRAHVSLL
jgi:hypothetical protein